MHPRRSPMFVGLVAIGLSTATLSAQTPSDTYFSLAVTENSHNHSGASLLFLDFQAPPFGMPIASLGEVVSTQVASGAITLDGDAAEWDPSFFTGFTGLVQSNYPLSEYIDALPTSIQIGSSWDAENVYFVVRWVDAGLDASTRRSKWIHGDQGGGEVGWNAQRHIGATPGAPNAAAVNASGHVLAGNESEDRVFFMFPIVDAEANFTPLGRGCATYCHANLADDFPWQNYTGGGVVAMHTNLTGDLADIWHWKASRTAPSGFADDKYLESGINSYNGRKSDSGTSAYFDNGLVGPDPAWMHVRGLRFPWDALMVGDAIAYSGTALVGDELPRQVGRPAAGSRGDVATASSFDPVTATWTVEFRRLRDTGNTDDHSFEGTPASPPISPLVLPGNPNIGAMMYSMHCSSCHQVGGTGVPAMNSWAMPRIQRASGSLIARAIETVPQMSGLGLLSDQTHEDIAAYLQGQATFLPMRGVSLTLTGAEGGGSVTSTPSGIDCPTTCTAAYTDGTLVTLHAQAAPGFVFAGWSGSCSGTGDCNLLLVSELVAIADFQPDCNGNGVPDGLDIMFGASADLNQNGVPDECENLGVTYCSPAVVNSTGSPGRMHALGSDVVADGQFYLAVDQLPTGQAGYFLIGQTIGSVNPPGSQGDLCLAGNIGRFASPAQVIQGPSGSIHVDLNAVPVNPFSAVLPGETWHFQCWYRDANPTPTSNFSDAISVTYQ